MRIVVVGAAGAIGSELVRQLVADNHQVTGIVRKAEQAAALKAAGVTPACADLASVQALSAIFEAQDAVIFTAGSKGKALDAIDRDGAINTAKAAGAAGVNRLVLLSSIYAGRPDQGPDSLREYFHAKHAADEFVQSTALDYTIVRPGFLTDDAPGNHVQIGEAFDGPEAKIARTDVAAILAAAVSEPASSRRTFEIINGDLTIDDGLKGPFPE